MANKEPPADIFPGMSSFNPEIHNVPAASGAGQFIAPLQQLAQSLAQSYVRSQQAPRPQGPDVAVDPTGRMLFINGKQVASNDYRQIVGLEQDLQRPGTGAVPQGWNRVPAESVVAYIQNIKNPGFGELFWRNVQQASYGLGQMAGGAIAALSPEGSSAEQAGMGLYRSSEQEARRYEPYQREFGRDPLGQFGVAALGQAVPSMAAGLAGGGIGGLGARAALGRAATAAGALAGAGAVGTGMGYGDYAQEDIEAGRTPRGSEYGLGPLVYGAIEYAPEALIGASLLGKGLKTLGSGMKGLGGRAARAGIYAGLGGAGEGAEELAQEELLIQYHDTWDAGYANSPEASHRRTQAFAGGAVPGVVLGGLGGAVSSPSKVSAGGATAPETTPTGSEVPSPITPTPVPPPLPAPYRPEDFNTVPPSTPTGIARPGATPLIPGREPYFPTSQPWRPEMSPELTGPDMDRESALREQELYNRQGQLPFGPTSVLPPSAPSAPEEVDFSRPGASPLIPGQEPIGPMLPPGFDAAPQTITTPTGSQLPLQFGRRKGLNQQASVISPVAQTAEPLQTPLPPNRALAPGLELFKEQRAQQKGLKKKGKEVEAAFATRPVEAREAELAAQREADFAKAEAQAQMNIAEGQEAPITPTRQRALRRQNLSPDARKKLFGRVQVRRPGATPLIPGEEPLGPMPQVEVEAQTEPAVPAVPKGQQKLPFGRKVQPNAAPNTPKITVTQIRQPGGSGWYWTFKLPNDPNSEVNPRFFGLKHLPKTEAEARAQALEAWKQIQENGIKLPITEAPNAQNVRVDEGQVRQGGVEGQPAVQRGPDQGSENLQRLPERASERAEAEQQAEEQVKVTVIPEGVSGVKRGLKKRAEVISVTPNIEGQTKEGVAQPPKTLRKKVTPTTPAAVEAPAASTKEGGPRVFQKKTKKEGPFERAPEGQREKYAISAAEKGLDEADTMPAIVAKYANDLDYYHEGKGKGDLNKDEAVKRVLNRMADAYERGDKETKEGLSRILKYYKNLTDEQVNHVRGVSEVTPHEGGKPKYYGVDSKPIGFWSPEKLRQVVHYIVSTLKNPPRRVVVLKDYDNLPAWLEEEFARQNEFTGEFAPGTTLSSVLKKDAQTGMAGAAISLPDTVVFFADYMPASRALVHAIAAHEMIGHHGFKRLLPNSERIRIFRQAALANASLNAEAMGHYDWMRQARPDLGLPESFEDALNADPNSRAAEVAADAVEEVLADRSATLDGSLIARIWERLTRFLNKYGVKYGPEDARYWVNQARAYVREGKKINITSADRMSRRMHYATVTTPEVEVGSTEALTHQMFWIGGQNDKPIVQDLLVKAINDAKQGIILNPTFSAEDRGALNRLWTLAKLQVKGAALPIYRNWLSAVIRTTTDVLDASPGGYKLVRYLRDQHAQVLELIKKYEVMTKLMRSGLNPKQLDVVGTIVHYNALIKSHRVQDSDWVTLRDREGKEIPLFIEATSADDALSRASNLAVNPEALRLLKAMGRPRIAEINGDMKAPTWTYRNKTEADKQATRDKYKEKLDASNRKYDKLLASAQTEEEKFRHEKAKLWEASKIESAEKAELTDPVIWTKSEMADMTFEGHKTLKEDSPEFQTALEIYDTIVEAALDQAKSRIIGAREFARELYGQNLRKAFGEDLDKAIEKKDSAFIRDVVARHYARLMDSAKEYDTESGHIIWRETEPVDKFLKDFIGAIQGHGAARKDFLDILPQKNRIEAEAVLDRLYQKFITPEQRARSWNIAAALRESYLVGVQNEEADLFAKKTIATGYVPFSRYGNYQLRLNAFAKGAGEEFDTPISLKDSPLHDLVAYFRFETEAEADLFRSVLADTVFFEKTYKVPLPGQEGLTEIQFKTEVGEVLDEAPGGRRISMYEFMQAASRLGVTLRPKDVEKVTQSLTKADASVRHRMLRSGNPGWSKDIRRTVSEHIDRTAHIIGANIYRPRIDALLYDDSVWRVSDAELNRARDAYDRARKLHGEKADATWIARRDFERLRYWYRETKENYNFYRNFAVQLINWYQGRKGSFKEEENMLLRGVRNATTMMQLGGSLAQVFVQTMSMFTHTWPLLSSYNPNTGFGLGDGANGFTQSAAKAATTMLRTIRQIGAVPGFDIGRMESLEEAIKAGKLNELSPAEREFLLRMTKEGHGTAAQYNALTNTALGIHSNALWQKFLNDYWMRPYIMAEEANRRISGMSAFRIAHARYINAGYSQQRAFDAAYKEAIDALNYAQGDYSMYARPRWARTGVMSLLFMYKMFLISTVQLIKNMGYAGRAQMFLLLWLVAGLKGLPFAEDLADIWDTIAQKLGFKNLPIELKVRKELANLVGEDAARFAMSGFLEAATGASWSPRVGVGDMVPFTGAFRAGSDLGREYESLLGPVAGFSRGVAGYINRAALTGDLISADALRELPISGVKNIVDGFRYYRDGSIRDKRGYIIAPEVGPDDIIMRVLGFYPTAASYQYELTRQIRQTAEYAKQIKASYVHMAVDARLRGDTEEYQKVLADVDAWNEGAPPELKINGFGISVGRAAREAQRPLAERTLRGAPREIKRNQDEWLTLFGFAQ